MSEQAAKPSGPRSLTPHETRLMDDFIARSKGMNKLNLLAGLAGCIAALLLPEPGRVHILLGILGGGVLGVALEKRYLNQMAVVLRKLYDSYLQSR